MPKGPFEIASPERALSRDLIAYNTGNLIFLEAAYKLLDTRDAVITPDRLEAPTIDPGSINERFDVYVVTLANAFRPSFEKYLQRLTSVIEKLTIPVTVLGVGLQAPLPYESGASRAWDDSVKAFVGAVLDRSPSIGVRGEYTQDYLNQLGFRDVEVIGCPSMFLRRRPDDHHEADADPRARRPDRHEHHHPGQPGGSARDVAPRALPEPRVHRPGPDRAEPDAVGRGRRGGRSSPTPCRSIARIRSSGTTRPCASSIRGPGWSTCGRWTSRSGPASTATSRRSWAGRPSYVLAHDSRTLELARYFEIPHRVVTGLPPDTDAAQLYEEADYGPLQAGHARRFRTFIDYVERQGLRHVFQPGEDPTAFDRKMASTDFPPPARTRTHLAVPPGQAPRRPRDPEAEPRRASRRLTPTRPDGRGTRGRRPASLPRPADAPRGVVRDLRVPLLRPRPRRPGVPQTPRREVAPCASHSCPWHRSPSSWLPAGARRRRTEGPRRSPRPRPITSPRTRRRPPAASPYDGVTYQDPGTNPVTDPTEDQVSTFAMDVDTASYSIAQRYVADGNTPDPASVRVEEWVNAFDQGYPAPEDATFGVHIDGAPSPFLASRDVLLRVGIRARDVLRAHAAGGRADVRHRHLRLDGPRGPARAGQGLAAPAGPRPRARRFDRGRHVRRRRARRAAADQGDRRRPDPVRHRRAPAGRLDQPRGGPHARLPAGARDPARRRRHRPGRSSPRTASRTSA